MKKSLLYAILCSSLLLFIETVDAQKKLYSKTLLWRITGNGLQRPSYLFGTMHLEDRRLFWFGDSLYRCLERAEGFAMEVNPDSAMIALFNAMNEPDTTGFLKDVLTKKELDRISKPLEKKYGVSANKITRKQAWMYSYNRSRTKKTDDMDTPVDTYLYNIAKRQGKWVGGIEDIKDQFNMVEELGVGFDVEGLLTEGGGKKAVDRLMEIYIAQDLNAISDWTNSLEDDTKDEMLIKRNLKMAFRMDSMARIRSNFFAVGAAHLPGEVGLIDLLEQKGFIVEPIISSKKISPEKYSYKPVELPWHKVEDNDKTFTMQMPGKPYPLMVKGVITMQTYADMGSGLVFLATSMRANKKSLDTDSMLAHFAKNLTGNKKIEAKRSIELNGVPGIEAFVSNEDYYYRLQGFVKGTMIYLTVTGASKKQILNSEEANRFHRSLMMNDVVIQNPAKDHAWKMFKVEKQGFEIEMPGVPERNLKIEENFKANPAAATWVVNCYTAYDEAEDVFYMLFVRAPKQGYHILNDTTLFSESRKNAENSFADTISVYELFTYQGYPAMRMNASYKESDYVMRSHTINRGDRAYTIIAITDRNSNKSNDIDRYLQSFKLTDYNKGKWSQQLSPDKVFRTWVPSSIFPFPKEDKEEATDSTELRTLMAYDTLSGYSFEIEKELISPYYWTTSDSAFFEEYSSQYISWQDSVLEKKSVQNGAVKGMEYFVKSSVISNIKRLRFLPYRDTLFIVFSFIPASSINDSDHNKFFSEFRFVNDVAANSYLNNKTSRLLKDLLSKDSLTFRTASSAIENAPFSAEDLSSLHQAMLIPYQDYDSSVQCTHDKILSAIVKLKHPSTIDFIEKNYGQLTGEKEQLKYPVLSVLARIHTAESYGLFYKLAMEQTPTSGNSSMLRYYLKDSILLTASLFPGILKLSGDSNFIKIFPPVINELLDSNLIAVNDVIPYGKNFYNYAGRELLRLKDEEEYDFAAMPLVELLAKFKGPGANELLQQFLKIAPVNIKEAAAMGLIKNNQAVDPMQLEKIAADKGYRNSLYSELLKAGKEKLFPVKYNSQKSFAEGEIYLVVSDEYEPSSIRFVGERTAEFKGIRQKFLLFKIEYQYEEAQPEVYLGIAGPYRANGKKILTESEASGLYSDEQFDLKKIDKHLKDYLERLQRIIKDNEVFTK